MAKCIQKEATIIRVSDEEASDRVKRGGWRYVPKRHWKSRRKPVEATDAV